MKTEVTEGEKHQVTLRIEADEEDLAPLIDQTYRDLGRQLKVPGFRKGKVPRKVIESHVGADQVRMEAIQNGLGALYVKAVAESGIFPVCDPEVKIVELGESGPVIFEATVDVKPEVEVTDYMGLEIERPATEVTDEDLQRALDEARDRFATLEVVETRPVEEGDFVLFDYKAFADGVPVEGSSGSDLMLQVGSEDFLPGFDEQLKGARKGDILDVTVTYPPDYSVHELAGKPATYRTIVKEIKRKVLPPLDDDLAREVSQFDTLEEYKEDLGRKIANIKRMTGERIVRERVIKALTDQTYIDIPESMIKSQIDAEIDELAHDLEHRGVTLEQYLEAMKGSRHQLENAIRERVVESLKSELVVAAVADAEDVQVSDEEAQDYLVETALAAGGDPDRLVADMIKAGRLPSVKASMRLSKAVDTLVGNAVYSGGGSPAEDAEKAEAEVAAEGSQAQAEKVEHAGEGTAAEAAPEEDQPQRRDEPLKSGEESEEQ